MHAYNYINISIRDYGHNDIMIIYIIIFGFSKRAGRALERAPFAFHPKKNSCFIDAAYTRYSVQGLCDLMLFRIWCVITRCFD